MSKLKRLEDLAYEQKFGNIPNTEIERVKYILGKKANDEKFAQLIAITAKKINRIKKKTIEFTMWKVVKPSARPRANTQMGYVHMYVPHAKQNGDWFEEFAKENNLPVIDTPCILNLKIYEKTPSHFNKIKAVLAELGYLRPWYRTGDFDNYAKGIADAIQHGMLKDDCLVYKSSIELFYSIKPHAEVQVTYWSKFPDI